ncbi:uncharacterized protein LOC105701862 isoform X2 [Orussus abietinus]|uniref:uncharacterized protein LOC105701862 isoform X2 n=1 Tax=Orussus abietinus TaxID=222816 RepID=UPI0006265F17|nr:uncharacterized protein LOC105701862 isoform X2 [Orussus abietinus]
MREEELEISLKVVIVGNGAVGKSSMIQRFCKGTYTRDYKKTIGVDFLERQIESGGIRRDYRGVLQGCPRLRVGVLCDRPGLLRRHSLLEAEGGERVRRDPHGAGAEQNGPDRSVRRGSVSIPRTSTRRSVEKDRSMGRGGETRQSARVQAPADFRQGGRRRRGRLQAPGLEVPPRDAPLRGRLPGGPEAVFLRT